MRFYDNLSQHYQDIFPLNEKQVAFVLHHTKASHKILDLGCANGALLERLAQAKVTGVGIDLNEAMITIAKNKDIKNMRFYVMDMLNIHLMKERFNTITCFGNTLVHLKNKKTIASLLAKAYQTLNNEGYFLAQIINYDRILDASVASLPTIETPLITMVRDYIHKKNKIRFKSTLITKESTTSSTVSLLPIRTKTMITLLEKAGFSDIKVYGNFEQAIYDQQKSMHLVISAKKAYLR